MPKLKNEDFDRFQTTYEELKPVLAGEGLADVKLPDYL